MRSRCGRGGSSGLGRSSSSPRPITTKAGNRKGYGRDRSDGVRASVDGIARIARDIDRVTDHERVASCRYYPRGSVHGNNRDGSSMRNTRGAKTDQQSDPAGREQDAERSPDHGEQHAFREQLP